MVEFISCMLLLVIFLLCFYDRKEKKRKEHEVWIYDCRQCLFRISRSFRKDCQPFAAEAFEKYNDIIQRKSYSHMPDYIMCSFLSDYRKSIKALEKDYIENVEVKAKESMHHYTFTSIPGYLIEEYTKEISDISEIFCDFEYLMWEQIHELKGENK